VRTKPRKARVKINYKSGLSETIICDEFTVKTVGAEILSVEWVNPSPRPLHIGANDIESVWEL
jgi:hypothetical protein